MYISPAYAHGSPATHTKVYAARSVDFFRSQFPVVAATCPAQLIVGAFNDYTEMNGWWPSKCPHCRTGEENDPYLFWNVTKEGLASVVSACGGSAKAEGGVVNELLCAQVLFRLRELIIFPNI